MTTAKRPKLTIVPRQLEPEVQPSTTRPNWTATEKLVILQEYEAYPRGAPERGALLRRKGIYTSHISKWRQQRNRGALTALSPQPRGPKPEPANPLADEVARLQQENARLQARLATAEAVIEIQKKLRSCLGRRAQPRRRASRDAGRGGRAGATGRSGAGMSSSWGAARYLLPAPSTERTSHKDKRSAKHIRRRCALKQQQCCR